MISVILITSSFVLPQELSGKGPDGSRTNTELKALASTSADSAAEVVREPSSLSSDGTAEYTFLLLRRYE